MARNENAAKLSLAIVEDLKGKGLSQSDIARATGFTRQYISWIVRTYGGKRTPRQEVLEHFPFEVCSEQCQTSPYRRLRDHGEYIATAGKGMSEDKLKRLRAFYRKLKEEGLVVEYDPEIPPIDGVSNKGGWAYRKRKPADGELLVRVNKHTRLTEEGRMIWRFPPKEP